MDYDKLSREELVWLVEQHKQEFASYQKRIPLALNDYQRVNLFELLHMVTQSGVFPFCLANTGDWAGEIYWMLKAMQTQTDPKPNRSATEQLFDLSRMR